MAVSVGLILLSLSSPSISDSLVVLFLHLAAVPTLVAFVLASLWIFKAGHENWRVPIAVGVLSFVVVGGLYMVLRLAYLRRYTPFQTFLIWPGILLADLACGATSWQCILAD